MADEPKQRILVIDREAASDLPPVEGPAAGRETVVARSMARALYLLRQGGFEGVYVPAAQLAALQWAGVALQAEEILEAIADGVVVLDTNRTILWANPAFRALAACSDPVGRDFYEVFGETGIVAAEPCPFLKAVAEKSSASCDLCLPDNRAIRISATPITEPSGEIVNLIALTHDITSEVLFQQKLGAIHRAGEELADLTPEELSELSPQERTDLLKFNITQHMKTLLGLDFVEIRLLEKETGRLVPLLTVGMTPLAARRELFAQPHGNGVTGYVAATGQSYLCPDTTDDSLYLEGAANARSSLTVPLSYHGDLIGTLNVENAQPNAFDERDRQLLEIYGRSVAGALNTLELLRAEKASTAAASLQAIQSELAIPLDDIISDATTALDRYAGHDEDIVLRLRHLLVCARQIRSLVKTAAQSVVPDVAAGGDQDNRRFAGMRILVVDAEEAIRRSAHQLLEQQGAIVETARDAHEAVALARQNGYAVAVVDIRLPDLNGYEAFLRLREARPEMAVVLMTGFGYDPTHSLVKARQDGLQVVLYKPFRVDRLYDAVEQATRPPNRDGNVGGSNQAGHPGMTPPGHETRH